MEMKMFQKRIVFLLLMMMSVFMIPLTADAKTVSTEKGNLFAVKGSYIYYSKNMDGHRMGIVKYNTKTKKKKTIVKYTGGNGYSNLTIEGNYIYALWDKECGTASYGPSYICRYDLNGKHKKNLACSDGFSIGDGRIYYDKCRRVADSYGYKYMKSEGLYSMKLDGSGKRRESGTIVNSPKVYASGIYHQSNDVDIYSGKYRYRLYCQSYSAAYGLGKIGGGKSLMLYRCNNHQGIGYVEIHGKWIMIQVNNYNTYDGNIILMNKNGKRKTTLLKWKLAE